MQILPYWEDVQLNPFKKTRTVLPPFLIHFYVGHLHCVCPLDSLINQLLHLFVFPHQLIS